MAVYVVLLIAIVETSVVSTCVLISRHVFGYIFTNEKEVIDYVTKMAPLLCVNIMMDGLQGVLAGLYIKPFVTGVSHVYFVSICDKLLLI